MAIYYNMDVDFLLSHAEALSLVSKDIISFNAKHSVKTRAQTRKSTSSCRMWQLIMCILDQLELHGYSVKELIAGHSLGLSETDEHMSKYNNMVEQISSVLDNVPKNRLLNALIYSNQTVPGAIEMYDPETMPLANGNNYMCIYIDGMSNSILHYFTIIKTVDEKYYMNSSYGSDYVCVNQYTTFLPPDEFIRFVTGLNNPDTDEDYIGEFYQKYFLAGNIGVSYSEDDYENDPSLRFADIAPNEGNLREIAVVTQNAYRANIRCGIMPGYGELVGSVVGSVYAGGRRRKTKKHRTTNKKNKRKTNKHVKTNKHRRRHTKRARSSRSSKRYSR